MPDATACPCRYAVQGLDDAAQAESAAAWAAAREAQGTITGTTPVDASIAITCTLLLLLLLAIAFERVLGLDKWVARFIT